MTINGLSANKTYYFKARSVTYPHTDTTETWYERNPNTVYSIFTQEINAKTLSVFVERLFFKLPQTVFEKQNIIQNAQVYIQNTQHKNVLISLAANIPEITYPQTVIIPKGMTFTYFDIGILDNNKIGSQKVILTASAPYCISAVSSITIIDDDDAPIHPPHKIYASSNGNQRVLITWPVQFGSDHLTYDVYRSDTEDGYYIQINPFPVYNPITIDGQYVHTFYDSELIYNTTYWYKVKTIRYGIYESELSQPISVIPKPHPGAGDFKLVILEPYQTLTAGQNAIFNISVIAEDHFNQEITLSASSNVLNTSLFNLNQSIVQPDTSTQLNVMIPVNIHPQEYQIKVNAISNCCSHSKEIIINVVYPNSGDSLITTVLSSNSVGLNNEVDIQGKIVPNVQNKTPYFIHIKQPDSDKWHTYNQFTENNSQFKFTYHPQHIGEYHIKSSWNGNNFLTPCESKEIVLNVGKGVSKIFCSTDKQDISPNDLIQLQAEILPQQEGMPVFIKVKKPDNSIEMIENMFTNHQGMVTTNFQLSTQTGMWQFTAYWPGNHQFIGAQSFPLSIYPGIETGQALIIAGSGIAHNTL
ncbi:hypothetical protein MHK_009260 [Candidatus Magnetomorum sp. HK-1]|nr:hypothetical protein MHK_009260 [Candidatus Magnetomorum sp. HK-1]